MSKPRPVAYLSIIVLLGAGFAFQMLLWSRQWIYGDQYALLTPAVEYLASGELAPFSKGMSGGGRIPGTLLQLLIAAPLALWADFRAPALAMALSQVAAVMVLLAVAVAARGQRFAAAFAAVYWLSPWRLYHSGFLWEPGFVLLPAALHLGCCWLVRSPRADAAASRGTPGAGTDGADGNRTGAAWIRFAASFGLGAVLLATLQIHASFVVLAAATGLLLWRRVIRVSPWGFILGGTVGGLTLMPTVIAFYEGELPRLAPHLDRRVALPLLLISNAGKAVLYWFRMGSADIGRRLRQTIWLDEPPAGTAAPFPLAEGLVAAVVVVSVATVLIAVYANWRYLAAPDRGTDGRPPSGWWLRKYAIAMLLALLFAGFIAPVPVQGWHVLIALHAACIAPALWLADSWHRRGTARALGVAFVVVLAITSLLVGLGHPTYLRPAQQQVERQDIPDLLRALIPPPAGNR